MPQIGDHLDFLLRTSQDTLEGDKRLIDEWLQSNIASPAPSSSALDDDWHKANIAADSVLHIFRDQVDTHSALLIKLEEKLETQESLNILRSILSSARPNDLISGEVIDVVGLDDMDLAMEILEHREEFKLQLDQYNGEVNSTANPVHHATDLISRDHSLSGLDLNELAHEKARKRMRQAFTDNASRPLFSGPAQAAPEVLPHVYTSSPLVQGNVLSQLGSKFMLPLGTVREMKEEYEEVIIPPAKPVPPRLSERLIYVTELDELARGCFPGYSTLNRIQSIVYPTAYGSNENLLICAPTGAGKTDVAMLTILRVIDQHRTRSSVDIKSNINRNSFKIIYVAPMKALASEIVRKLGKRLKWLAIEVRELTGDMQLTKLEISQTQIIVTTPEKWDVVTRKPTGEGELASSLKLLIIDEVHLLNEERGAVIETIVARTLRQVESSQSMIRIVGLSATLPNYIDVAEFLSVSRYKGLFYFDSSFRPVPLEQHFLGIKGKPGSPQSRKNLDRVTFDKVSDLVSQGHQVMVFVHARKETVKAATSLHDLSVAEGNFDDFSCEDHPQWNFFRRSIGESRNKEMKLLFDAGFGIHHAGMLRSDRNMMERMFEAKAIKVLCCTATLAWGVNLPAHAVIIKGTQVYDSSKGAFVDLSVLDVLQVFGRAGRPGYESSGEGYICTTEDKLTHYLDAITSQLPIESQFQGGLIDSLNAEIALGTVANSRDAVQWLGYTYLFVRMRKNPFVYGITRDSSGDDPYLGAKRNELIFQAAQKLADTRMIVFDRTTGMFTITDLGRIAAKYYIQYTSIEIFNKEFRPKMTEADVLGMLSMSTEFGQIKVRENEIKELEQLAERIPCDVKGGPDSSQGKVNVLLQGYISRESVEDFALVSDMAYAAQNGGRIIRALLEIAVSRKWANVTAVLMGMSKAIEKQLWPFDNPLKQFSLRTDVLHNLQQWADEWSVAQLASVDASSIGQMIHMNEQHGLAILNCAKQFPSAEVTYDLKPLGGDVLKIAVQVHRSFSWNHKTHGNAEPCWLWIEDHNGLNILQVVQIMFRESSDVIKVDFVISIPDPPPPSVTIRWVSDKWMGAEDEILIPLDSLIMPAPSQYHSPNLNLPFLSLSTINNHVVEGLFSQRFTSFNTMQTQTYWGLVNTKWNSLLCGPCGSGKTTMAHIVAWKTVMATHEAWILIVTPQRTLAAEIFSDFRIASQFTGVPVELVTGKDVLKRPRGKCICIVASDQLLHALSIAGPRPLMGINLVICDSLEQLDSTYELAVSLLRHATQFSPTRYIGMSNSLNDPADLADWLGVNPFALCSFRPKDRDQSLAFSTHTFTMPYSAALFKTMAKPVHEAIIRTAMGEPVLVFVPSRAQCRSVALDLITQCSLQMETARGYLPGDVADEDLDRFFTRLEDPTLADFISKGVGFFHPGITKSDRKFTLELYSEGILRVLIVPRDSCYTVPVRAATVVVMGTQYVHFERAGTDRQIRDYGLTDLVQMQNRAIRHVGSGHFHLFCPSESLDTFTRFLNEGLPLESQILDNDTINKWYTLQCRTGQIEKQQLVEALSFTFLARRVVSNPTYYGFASSSANDNLSRITDKLVDNVPRG